MANYYCEWCGEKFSSIQSMANGTSCMNHPDGAFKGKHKLYEGSEKTEYFCKYCGDKFSSIQSMKSGASCRNHPDGAFKGKCAPAL